METLYVITDIEADGPVPGQNSMLSFASVATDATGRELDAFEAVVEPLEGAGQDPITMAWFADRPQALAAATADPKRPAEVMARYIAWIRALHPKGAPVFVAHPIAFDGPWIDFYLQNFAGLRLMKGPWAGERLFYSGGLCLRSFAAGKLGWPLHRCNDEQYPADWLGGHDHTHKAIDDARSYAALLAHLLAL